MKPAWILESEAVSIIGCSPQTLRVGADRGQLNTCQNPFTGEWMYVNTEIDALRTNLNRELARHIR